jgi:cation/acetate symporter
LVTPAPRKDIQDLVDHVRYPTLRGDTMNTEAT